jgi:hypothetical protein
MKGCNADLDVHDSGQRMASATDARRLTSVVQLLTFCAEFCTTTRSQILLFLFLSFYYLYFIQRHNSYCSYNGEIRSAFILVRFILIVVEIKFNALSYMVSQKRRVYRVETPDDSE